MRRAGAALLVLASGLVLGAPGDPSGVIVDDPPGPIDAIDVAVGSSATSVITLRNAGATDTTLTTIDADACDPGVTADPTPADLPQVLIGSGSGTHGVTITCAATPTSTIRRCQFHAKNNATPLVNFTALCVATGTEPLDAEPTAIDFGDVPVNGTLQMPITVTNTGSDAIGTLAIQLSDQAGNFKVNAPCTQDVPGCNAPVAIPAGGSTTVMVSCTPTALGSLSAQALFVGDNGGRASPVQLTCNGVAGAAGPHITLDKTVLDFHGIAVASTSSTGTIHVASTGTSDLTISALSLAGGVQADWSFSATAPCNSIPCTLPAGSTTDILVTFDPSQIGARDSSLQIASTDATHPTTTIALDGVGLGATLAIDSVIPAAGIDLGSVPLGGSASFALAVRNDGNITLSPVALSFPPPPPDALTLDNATISVPPSGSAQVTLTCAPTVAGPISSALTLDPKVTTPITIPIKCTGVTGSLLATPGPIALDEIRTNTGVHTTTVTLSTLGATTLDITEVPSLAATIPTGMSVSALSSMQVAPAAPATFTLSVDATSDADLTEHVSVAAGSDALDIPVFGKVVTAAVTAPASRELGSFCVNQPTSGTTIGLLSAGTASIHLDAPAMGGGTASPFELAFAAPIAYPFKLPAGQSANVVVTPKRQSGSGTETDQIVWTTDVDGSTAPTTTVDAEFISDGGAIAPGTLAFDPVPIHTLVQNDQTITVQNCGSEDMTLAAPEISPQGPFHIANQALPKQLAPTETGTLQVLFAPVEKGTFDATLTVSTSKGDLVVPLHGDGIVTPGSGSMTPEPPPADGCGCHTSDVGGNALVMAAMCAPLACRRRRRPSIR